MNTLNCLECFVECAKWRSRFICKWLLCRFKGRDELTNYKPHIVIYIRDMGHDPLLYLLPAAPSSIPDLSPVTSLVERHMPCNHRKATEVMTSLNVSLG